MIHRTYRSLDRPPKLLGFTIGQWAALIAGTAAVLGVVYLTGIAVRAAVTLGVFIVGLPAALTYVSESGGLELGRLLSDMLRWRIARKTLHAHAGNDSGAGLLIAERRAGRRRMR